MNKEQIDARFSERGERKKAILKYSFGVVFLLFLSLLFSAIYSGQNKKETGVFYAENSDVDYLVYLKDNQYYEEQYLDKNSRYVSSLIDYIDSNFNYELDTLGDFLEYKYKYRLEAETTIKGRNDLAPLYHKIEELIPEEEYETDKVKLSIQQKYTINYNYYNDLAKRFIGIYNIDDADSSLKINLYVSVFKDYNAETPIKESVVTLNIPLTTKTVSLEASSRVLNGQSAATSRDGGNEFLKVLSIISLLASIIMAFLLVKYIRDTNTPESLYTKELKRILSNYGSYIQKITDLFNTEKYEIVNIETFNDMLEIRDTISQPILMMENDEKTEAYFVIPSATDILYIYTISIDEMGSNNEKRK